MKKIIFKLVRYSGLPFIFRELIQRNKVTILMFHDIDKKTAKKTFSYLVKNYNLIDLNDFIEACKIKDNKRIPKKALIITFDDGHLGNYELVPLIKKFDIPVTIFLCSSIINTNRHYWFRFQDQPIDVPKLKLESTNKRLELLSKVGFKQDKEYNQPQALQRSHIDQMKHFINMQSHTMFHPILPRCTFEDAKKEIFNSKEFLEREYDLKINAIAYPNGDYSERDITLVKKAGYECGITVDYGFNTIHSDLFKLKRLSSNDTKDLNELIVKSSGVWGYIKHNLGKRDY